jgi:hypothetical protein
MVALFDLYLALIEQQIKMMNGDKKTCMSEKLNHPFPSFNHKIKSKY